jgi:hypothetical protein
MNGRKKAQKAQKEQVRIVTFPTLRVITRRRSNISESIDFVPAFLRAFRFSF